jgi:hypothetical protein
VLAGAIGVEHAQDDRLDLPQRANGLHVIFSRQFG